MKCIRVCIAFPPLNWYLLQRFFFSFENSITRLSYSAYFLVVLASMKFFQLLLDAAIVLNDCVTVSVGDPVCPLCVPLLGLLCKCS